MSEVRGLNEFDTWLKAFPREEAVRRIAELEAELTQVRSALKIHDTLAEEADAVATVHVAGSSEGPNPSNRPQAILEVLKGAKAPLRSREIREALIARGWMEDTSSAHKRLYTTVSRMSRSGRILRLADGRYVLPTQEETLGID